MNSAANSAVAKIAAASTTSMPPSFNGDSTLLTINLAIVTAIMSLAVMMFGRMAIARWRDRRLDRPRDPIAVLRTVFVMVAIATALRTGMESMYLFAWSPNDPETTARVVMAKRWIDPVSGLFTAGWMALLMLSIEALERQLRQRPLQVKIWARVGTLKRPAVAVMLSLVMAVGVVWTRG